MTTDDRRASRPTPIIWLVGLTGQVAIDCLALTHCTVHSIPGDAEGREQ